MKIVRILRKFRGKEIADKYLRRMLRVLKAQEINLIAKRHNIDRKLSNDDKAKEILKDGITLTSILTSEVYKEGAKITEKKNFVNEFWVKRLNIKTSLKGVTLQDKIDNLITYFDNRETDEKVGISIDGYEKMLIDLNETLPKLNKQIKEAFELQDEFILKSELFN